MARYFIRIAAAIGLSFTTLPASAETFSVRLGNKSLGTLSYSVNGNDQLLQSVLSNTPLGVFNGTFKGTSKQVANPNGGKAQAFTGASKSSRKERTVTTMIANGRAIQTKVTPEKERTALSDIAKVPAGVVDPVTAIGELLRAKGCPATIKIYDGRRAIALSPQSSEQAGDQLTCSISYKVFAGPGHLSPLKITSARMKAIYTVTNGQQHLRQIQLGSGIFNLFLDRTG